MTASLPICHQADIATGKLAGKLAVWQDGNTRGKPDSLSNFRLASVLALRYASRMTIIAVANSKGGVGKSTTAVHLAAWLHEQGHSVTLADCDTQQSSSEWIREAVPGINAVRLDNPDHILNELPLLEGGFWICWELRCSRNRGRGKSLSPCKERLKGLLFTEELRDERRVSAAAGCSQSG